MKENEKKSFKEKAKEIIDVSTEGSASTISEIFLEGALGAVVPGATSVVFSYKQKRMEKNLLRFITELQERVSLIEEQFGKLGYDDQQLVRDIFAGLVCDYVIDEQEEEKIKYIANGFVSLTGSGNLQIDQTIIFLDILKNLRFIDIRILFDRVNGFIHYVENFNDYLIELGISHDQYVMIKEKLLRLGLLKSSYDDDFQKIVKKVNDITDYTMSLQKGKPKKLPNNFASFKPKDRETITTSKLGRSFFEYFSGEGKKND
ncbi:hypothetical protein OJ967_12150 [Peribacillus frigoritolerans]|uniref:hypothetical protein n=1 Tax=Peribacillus frigoritolerans TaxID=450367 RepID=UPI0022273BA7|nr:hypothetical protein [Peribacillus frigoritolerans]UYZ01177.1 hypothetical protein OJ967_12150 [Peribacillus frigoritolerans]